MYEYNSKINVSCVVCKVYKVDSLLNEKNMLFNEFWGKWNVRYPFYKNLSKEAIQHLKITAISDEIWHFLYGSQESNKIFSQNSLISNTTQKLYDKKHKWKTKLMQSWNMNAIGQMELIR